MGAFIAAFIALSCSGDAPNEGENIGELQQALTTNDSILGFEGPVGGSSPDWTPASGTVGTSSNTAFSGAQALALSGNANASAVSAKLTTLGAVASSAKIQVALPPSLQGQGWFGQIALFLNAPSAGVYNQYAGATPFVGPLGQYRQYSIAIPSGVVTALSTKTYSDLTITVQLNVPSTSGAFLIDELNLGTAADAGVDASEAGADADASQGAGGSTGNGGASGVGGAQGAGGIGGQATGGGSGSGGSSGSAGAAGDGGSGGGLAGGPGSGGSSSGSGGSGAGGSASSAQGTTIDFFFKLPNGVRRQDLVFATTDGDLFVDDGVKLLESSGFASVSSVEGGKVNRIGVATQVASIWSGGDVALANNAHVHGALTTTGALSEQAGAVVDGAISEHATLDPLQTVAWSVLFPSQTLGSASLEPDQVRALAPGAYSDTDIKSRAHLKLSPGVYTFDGGLTIEPQAVLEVDNSAAVQIYSRTGFTFRGTVQAAQNRANILFGTAATGAIPIDTPFSGILVAPYGAVALASTSVGHTLSVFAQSITAHQNTNITHEPFTGRDFCSPGLDAPGCPSHCSNGVRDDSETDVDCGGDCPSCQPGHVCSADVDCGGGLVCGSNNGACFGFARGTNICWKPECELDNQTAGCGQPDSVCGSNCACLTQCDAKSPTNVCAPGETCKARIGPLFNALFADACVDPRCPSNDPALCGGPDSLCGPVCICTPNCSSATCASPGDGCHGTCPSVCKPPTSSNPTGDTGCTDDVNCPAGYVCLSSLSGVHTCRPSSCAYRVLAPPLCGTPGAVCGEECPACTTQCDGRACGPDPNCGRSCGTCGAGTFCGTNGQCITPAAQPPILVPDGQGGQRPLEDLHEPPPSLVGAVKGTFNVSEMGTAEYSIPIEVPPGRAGMEPALALQYSGSRSNENVGVGWHLDGLSQITRCPKVHSLDGLTSPVQNDTSDHFCIDGKRLEAVQGVTTGTVGAYGADGTEYRTLIDSFARVVSHQDVGNGVQLDPATGIETITRSAQGPDFFLVSTKDGRILTFGRTRDALVLSRTGARYSWLLSRIEDHVGNTITIAYSNLAASLPTIFGFRFPNVVRPSIISYTGHTGTGSVSENPGNRQVKFTYETRGDGQLRIAQGGVPILAEQRLARVTTFVNDAPVKNYHLVYYGDRPLSQVEKVFECTGGDDTYCKPPTVFHYKEESGYTFGGQGLDIAGAAQLDINGDGIPDFLATKVIADPVDESPLLEVAEVVVDVGVGIGSSFMGPAGMGLTVAYTLGEGAFWGGLANSPNVHLERTIFRGTGHRESPTVKIDNVSGLPCGNAQSPAFILDYDRDGKDDVLITCGLDNQDFYVAHSLGDGTFEPLPGPSPTFSLGRARIKSTGPTGRPFLGPPSPPVMFDVDGDSLQDIVYCPDQYTLAVLRRLGPKQGFGDYLARPTQPQDTPTKTHPNPPPRANQLFCGESNPVYKSFDIDGDGTPDLLFRDHASGLWFVLRYTIENGARQLSFVQVTFPDVGGSAEGDGLSLGDFNGDGLVDVWHAKDKDPHAIIWLNTGGGQFSSHTLDRPLPALQQSDPFEYFRTAVADSNGDGRTDLMEIWRHDSLGFQGPETSFFDTALVPDGVVSTLGADFPVPGLLWPITTDLGTHEGPGGFLVSGDIDGDGVTDLFGFPKGAFFGNGAHNLLLDSVVDGVGNVIDVSYDENDPYSADDACKSAMTWPEKCLPRMTGLVSSHTEGFKSAAGPEVDERMYDYHYANARMNLTGQGWLGFDQRTVTLSTPNASGNFSSIRSIRTDYEPVARYDTSGNLATDLTKPYLYPLAGLPKVVTTDTFVDPQTDTAPLQTELTTRRTQVQNQWSVQVSADKRPFPFVQNRFTFTYDKKLDDVVIGPPPPPGSEDNGERLTNCFESFTPDGYGNVTSDEERCQTVSGSFTERTLTTRDFERDRSNWLISNPTSVAVTGEHVLPHGLSSQTQTWSLTYTNGMLDTATRAPDGSGDQRKKTTYERDDFGNVKTITDEVSSGEPSRVTHITYDPDNVFPASMTNPLGQRSQVHFEAKWGTPLTTADPNGIGTRYGYDDFGRLVETRGPEGTTTVTYSSSPAQGLDTAAGHIEPRIGVTVERQGTEGTSGGRVTSEYDSYGRLVRSLSAGFGGVDVIDERAYDALSRLRAMTRPHTADLSAVPTDKYTYDHLDRVTRVDHSDGTAKQYQYATFHFLRDDARQWVGDINYCVFPDFCAVDITLTIDEEQKKNVVVSDLRGLVIRSIDGDNVQNMQHSSNYAYGAFNRLVEAKDNLGNSTAFSYDPYGRRIGLTDPDAGPTVFTYNGFDEPKTSKDPKQQTRTYSYDDLGRMTSIVDPAGTSQWIYDQGINALGRLSESISPATDANPDGQHIRYTYEPLAGPINRGFVQKVDHTLDGTSYPITIDYDDLGRTHRIHYPHLGSDAPVVAQYGYDTSGALTHVEEVGGAATRPLWQLDQAFQGHLIQHETFGDGSATTYGYNADRRWLEKINTSYTSFVPQDIQAIEYTHFGNGLIKTRSRDDLRGSPDQREYQYDNLNRLSFTLDTSPTQQQGVGTPYTYDALGNITGRGATVITNGTAKPHLIQAAGASSYSYDPNGNVAERLGPDTPGGGQFFQYTPFDLPSSIAIGAGTTPVKVSRFEYSADEERVVRRDGDTTRYFVGDLYERLISTDTGATVDERFRLYVGGRQIGEIRKGISNLTQFFHAEAIGTVDTVSTDEPSFVHQEFDPFGMPIDTPGITRTGFTGHDHDNDLGLIDMKGRIYDPLAARFTSADPVIQATYWSQGLNRYSYAFNNPVNNVDPSGFDVSGDIVGGTIAAGHVAGAGIIAYGFGAGIGNIASGAASAVGSGANAAYKAATGGLAGAARAGTSAPGVAPSAALSSTGRPQGAMNDATAQVMGRVGPNQSIPKFDGQGGAGGVPDGSGGHEGAGGGPSPPINPGPLFTPVGDGRYVLSDVARARLKPTYDKIGGIPDATVEFGGVTGGAAETDLVSGKARITIDSGDWADLDQREQIRLIAHEYVHPLQYNNLGRWSLYARRLGETIRFGHDQYVVTKPLLDLPLEGFNVADPRFTLESIANHVSDFVPKGSL